MNLRLLADMTNGRRTEEQLATLQQGSELYGYDLLGLLGNRVSESTNGTLTIARFPSAQFKADVMEIWGTSKLMHLYTTAFSYFSADKITMYKFFACEFYYVLSQLPARQVYKNIQSDLLSYSWLQHTQHHYSPRVRFSKLSDTIIKLKPYQTEFIEQYDSVTQQYNLNGYLNASDQGSGKTIMALSLMHCLGKEKVCIIAPNNTLYATWEHEIQSLFKTKQSIWTPNNQSEVNARWYIVNYESITKFFDIKELLRCTNVGIIVDEIHHFRSPDTNRSKFVVELARAVNSVDVLAMSGTPIKALGNELIPLLKLIDPLFTEDVEAIFKSTFGLTSLYLTDILRNRLQLFMFRKLKSEILDLPIKEEKEILVKMPTGNKYTLQVVKSQIEAYVQDRKLYYSTNYERYVDDYELGLTYYKTHTSYNVTQYNRYEACIASLRTKTFKSWTHRIETIKFANVYEKEYILPSLPAQIKRDFVKAKSVVKYVDMVILGETIGNLLVSLRTDMCNDMLPYTNIDTIVKTSIKKTILFTTQSATVESMESYCTKNKLTPITIYAKTAKNANASMSEFKSSKVKNPLITTIKMMSTGVTLTEANTVCFLPRPFRYVDYAQASDRVHRLGQTDPCYIYTFVLDTGDEPNLSTRIEDIVKWSQALFENIVNTDTLETTTEEIVPFTPINNLLAFLNVSF